MGELARTLVALSGPDSVHGIIPRALLGEERVGDEDLVGEKAGKRRGWWARMPFWGGSSAGRGQSVEINATVEQTHDTASLLSESIYGRTTVVRDLSARKRRMIQEIAGAGPGSGFVALSGGFGTLDEVMEVVTGWQMGVHRRGVCLFNVEGFWDGLVGWVERAVEAGFVREEGRGILGVKGEAEECVEWLREWGQGGSGKG